jgi:hypothetical protein
MAKKRMQLSCNTDIEAVKREKILSPPGARPWHDWLNDEGAWDTRILITLGSAPEHPRSPMWFLERWRRVLTGYWREKHNTVRYLIVANRGPSGTGRGSAHVIFEEPLPDLKLLARLWRRHGIWHLSDDGDNAVAYVAKNCAEPDPDIEHWGNPVTIRPGLALTLDPADGASMRWLYEHGFEAHDRSS